MDEIATIGEQKKNQVKIILTEVTAIFYPNTIWTHYMQKPRYCAECSYKSAIIGLTILIEQILIAMELTPCFIKLSYITCLVFKIVPLTYSNIYIDYPW